MTRSDFLIGQEFYTASGAWRCTDVGTRVVTAVKLGYSDPKVYEGPPFSIPEFAFDEEDQRVATRFPQPLVVIGVLEARPSTQTTAALQAVQNEVDRLRRVCQEAYQFATVVGAPARVLDNLWAAAEGQPLPHETFLPVSRIELHAR